MNTTQKLVAVVLFLTILFGIAGSDAVSENGLLDMLSVKASSVSVDDLTYEIIDGSAKITGCDINANGSLDIPASIEGAPVRSIGEGAFYLYTGLTRIKIPDSVTSIGKGAFFRCTGLTSVTIPDSVTSIGNSAFYGCTVLTKVVIPGSVTNIDDSTFSNCTGLTSVTIENGVKSIGKNAFSFCENITSITIPNSVTSIDNNAFRACSKLETVTIGRNLASIGESVFAYCPNLTYIRVNSGNTAYCSPDNCLIEMATKTLITGGKTCVIPNDGSVTRITIYAFIGHGNTNITIPDTVSYIGAQAFYHCTNLESINIPKGVIRIYSGTFRECESLTSIIIPEGIISLGLSAFWACTHLTDVTLPKSVTEIGNNVFYNCKNLRNVYYSGSEADREKISIGNNNECLLNAKWHYNPSDSSDSHSHCFNSIWYYNETSHWNECSCSKKGNVATHSFNSGTTTKQATKAKTGEKTFRCMVCGYEKKEIIPKLKSDEPSAPDTPFLNIPKTFLIIGNPSDRQMTYDYKTTVTFTANVPEGGSVLWFVDGKKVGTDSTLTVKDSTSSYKVMAVVTDKDGNQTKDEENVTIKNGFLDKIIWFFKHLFNPGAYDVKQ